MLNLVHIQDFQSLEDVKLKPGWFTVITGESDTGKSAVVRAIKSVLINRSGQGFIRHGSKSASVRLDFNDAYVTWRKEGASASYVLDGREFVKVGASVPSDISEALSLGEVTIADRKLTPNVHEQFDLPFLVMDSSINRAKILGEVSGVNVLYLASAEVRKQETSAKRLMTTRAKDIEEVNSKLDSYRYLVDVQKSLQEAEHGLQNSRALHTEITSLARDIASLVNFRESFTQKAITVRDAIKEAKLYQDLADEAFLIQAMETDVALLAKLLDNVSSAENSTALRHKEMDNLNAQLSSIDVCPTCNQPVAKWEV